MPFPASEEEQRTLPCHQKEKSPEYGPWDQKLFTQKRQHNLLTGHEEDFWIFNHACYQRFEEGEPKRNLIRLSQATPDVRTPDWKPAPRGGKKVVKKRRKRKPTESKNPEENEGVDLEEDVAALELEDESGEAGEGEEGGGGGGGGGESASLSTEEKRVDE